MCEYGELAELVARSKATPNNAEECFVMYGELAELVEGASLLMTYTPKGYRWFESSTLLQF